MRRLAVREAHCKLCTHVRLGRVADERSDAMLVRHRLRGEVAGERQAVQDEAPDLGSIDDVVPATSAAVADE